MLKYVAFGLFAAVVAIAAYVRLAPVNGDRWHAIVLPQGAVGEFTATGSYTALRRFPDAAVALDRLDQIIRATPRTRLVEGSVGSGKITYVTRSLVFGFPDYTTVAVVVDAAPGQANLAIFGRLRFGASDLGVNRARIMGWLDALDGAMAR